MSADSNLATVALPRAPSLRLPRVSIAAHPRAGRIALGALVAGTFVLVAFATAGVSPLVPSSGRSFPPWESGPLHLVMRWLPRNGLALNILMSVVLVAMLGAYCVILAALRTVSMRWIVGAVLTVHAIVLLAPPMQLNDVFNYVGYARLGALHHLNPYTHVIDQEIHDPVFRFSSWHNLHSPYGPLFTALSYPLGLLSLPLSYWILKVVTLLTSLGFLALVWDCARRLGRDPRFALAFVAANPIYIIYAMGGFHNDWFMLVPLTAGIALLLARHDRSAGAVLMLAVAVKFTAILLLPFLLVAVWPARRRMRDVVTGALLGAIPLAAMSVALFGFSLPNLRDQSTLLTDFSIPNVVGWLIGLGGGTPGLLRIGNVLLVVAIALLLRRRGPDWLSAAGWATAGLIASLAWLMPWYVIWLLPLAGFGTSIRLRRAALALTVFLIITFMPVIWIVTGALHIHPMSGPPGRVSAALQNKLSQ